LNTTPGRAVRTALRFLVASLVLMLPGGAAHGASKFFHTSDGVRLHYLEAGSGRTLVFVPGWSMPAEIWAPQVQHFAARYRVIAFDPRGQGRSAIAADGYTLERRTRDLKELLDALGPQPVALVGWSLGVLEALAYTHEFGDERLAALVLVDNSIGEDPPPVSDPTFLERLRNDREATVERFVRRMYRSPQSPPYLEGMTRAALRVPHEASIRLLAYPRPREFWRESLHAVRTPLMYAVTARFRGQAESLKRRRPGAWTEVFENAGHALFVDEAARFNALLAEFLDREVWREGARGG
jgi:microsomal epoxide hydrolase